MAKGKGRPPKSAFGAKSTAEEVSDGVDLTGKVAFVTGVNSGIGQETMRVLAMRGAHVIGAARTLKKAREACAQIDGETTPVACELSDFQSVVQCANAVSQAAPKIDILICNAGIMALPKLEQKNGLELQFMTNHMGHFVLVSRLIENVIAADAGRVVMLSSSAHTGAYKEGIQFDNLSGDDGYTAFGAYGQSKLANLLFSNELNRRLADTNATSNALHPGVIATNLGRHMSSLTTFAFAAIGGILSLVGMSFFKDVPQGAATTCYVATSSDLDGIGGFYFADCNLKKTSDHGRDQALAAKLWDASEEIAANFV
jgi:NAD(P)-dependent dehydrogenase (short-subunit alcohol dehydrogenase family)